MEGEQDSSPMWNSKHPMYSDLQYTRWNWAVLGSNRDLAVNYLGRWHLRKCMSLLWSCLEMMSNVVFHFICNCGSTFGHVNFIHTFTQWKHGLLEQLLKSRLIMFNFSPNTAAEERTMDKFHLSSFVCILISTTIRANTKLSVSKALFWQSKFSFIGCYFSNAERLVINKGCLGLWWLYWIY